MEEYKDDSERRKQEIREAIAAGENAVLAFKSARKALESAGGWGAWDMFAGGFITSLIKHSKLDTAKEELSEASRRLKIFKRELQDVSDMPDVHVNVGGFLQFADIFLDNFFVDWAVQSQISKAKGQVDSAINRIQSLVVQLKVMEQEQE